MESSRVPKIRVGDVGTEFSTRIVDADDEFTHDDDDEDAAAVPLTGATLLQIRAEKPDGTVVDWTATGGSLQFPERTAARGWLRYLTLTGDLDQAGHWKLQARITIGTGSWRAEIHDILVHANL